ncbi:MAG: glycosyltransferase family 4 protein [Vicinamibacteria bacterium]
MSSARLRIRRPSFFGVEPAPRPLPPGTEEREFAEVKAWLAGPAGLRRHLLRYEAAELVTSDLEHLSKPFHTALMLRLLARGACFLGDDRGRRVRVNPVRLAAFGWRHAREVARAPWLPRSLRRRARRLAAAPRGAPLDLSRPPLYLRTDLVLALQAGGSVGHVAGVVNNLGACAAPPVFVTSAAIPTVRPEIETHVVPPGPDFCGFEELPLLQYNERAERAAAAALGSRVPAFVYHRYALYSLAGLSLARRLGVPFVLEYNGSELWISRHWGRPLRFAEAAREIETALLRAADLVVVVSRPIRDELVAQGLAEEAILVNPNGVDPDRYSPDVDGEPVRRRLGLEGRRVVGFIGTFGRWHGAEVLAEAFGRLLARRPEWRDSVRLLMIGDGATMPLVREALARHAVSDLAVLTGVVPQVEGPAHLAAADVLASPHVRNPDGTPFFGSPTKLFEYMAMGRSIVASDIDQVGEVLRHGETAWLVEPGDADALAAGLERLLSDSDLARRLGEAARRDALGRHTWKSHTQRIVEALARRCRDEPAEPVGAPEAKP